MIEEELTNILIDFAVHNENYDALADHKQKILNLFYKELYNRSPMIIKQRLCNELANICSSDENKSKLPREIPFVVKIFSAMDVLEDIYPELKVSK